MTERIGPKHGVPFETPTGRAIIYRIECGPRLLDPKARAITYARGHARHDGHTVLDVNSAVEQPDNAWLIELRIRENGAVK